MEQNHRCQWNSQSSSSLPELLTQNDHRPRVMYLRQSPTYTRTYTRPPAHLQTVEHNSGVLCRSLGGDHGSTTGSPAPTPPGGACTGELRCSNVPQMRAASLARVLLCPSSLMSSICLDKTLHRQAQRSNTLLPKIFTFFLIKLSVNFLEIR